MLDSQLIICFLRFSEITPEGKKVTQLDSILLNGSNVCIVRQYLFLVSISGVFFIVFAEPVGAGWLSGQVKLEMLVRVLYLLHSE
jgi:hypothetical protein